MNLREAIAAAGMTPPPRLVPGRWLRFPGVGKGRANRAGWCRMISPTLAIYGDWSSGLTAIWKDDAHRDDERSRQLLHEARERERLFAAEQRRKQATAAEQARELLRQASVATHPYLAAKGFPDERGLVTDGRLLIPVRDAWDGSLISMQLIDAEGEKRFLPSGRTRGGIHRLGMPGAQRSILCEGYATGLTLHAALKRLPGTHAVLVCFSAGNLVVVASACPGSIVAADNDATGAGEQAARQTGLQWLMPPAVGEDFNDWHRRAGLMAVVQMLAHPPPVVGCALDARNWHQQRAAVRGTGDRC